MGKMLHRPARVRDQHTGQTELAWRGAEAVRLPRSTHFPRSTREHEVSDRSGQDVEGQLSARDRRARWLPHCGPTAPGLMRSAYRRRFRVLLRTARIARRHQFGANS
jgi:hypothetical protein